jgi:hypothetical protein
MSKKLFPLDLESCITEACPLHHESCAHQCSLEYESCTSELHTKVGGNLRFLFPTKKSFGPVRFGQIS